MSCRTQTLGIMRYFFPKAAFRGEAVPQGKNEWINFPDFDENVPGLLAARATIKPGMGHDFHLHPGREEIIYVLHGEIDQWVDRDCCRLAEGDAVIIPADRVHASFNAGAEDAVLFVVLTPAKSDAPLGIDVSGQEPWNTLRKTAP